MYQVNTYVFYQIGSLLRDCRENAQRPIKDWITSAKGAADELYHLTLGISPFALDESRDAALALQIHLEQVPKMLQQNGDAVLTDEQQQELYKLFAQFSYALEIELGRAPIFLVSGVGIFDTRTLIEDAARAYGDYRDRLPERTITDTNQAGRCLAFSLPTASGFHMARATESVIKQYMADYGCTPPKESDRNWSNYIKALRLNGAHPKITHHLDQIRALHRNPVSHPDTVLTMPQATAFMALCQSVIQAMVGDMESRRKDGKSLASIVALRPTDEEPGDASASGETNK